MISFTAIDYLMFPSAAAGQQTSAEAPGFTPTLDRDIFKNETFVIKPLVASYANNYWRSSRVPRVDRLDLQSVNSAGGPWIRFGAPPRAGAFAFDHSDEDKPDRIVAMT
jgi:hypothetical protein